MNAFDKKYLGLLAMILCVSCAGPAANGDSFAELRAQVDELRTQQEVLLMAMACDYHQGNTYVLEAAGIEGLADRCLKYRSRQMEQVAQIGESEQEARLASLRRQNALANDPKRPRDEPWATQTEAKLSAAMSEFLKSDEYRARVREHTENNKVELTCDSVPDPVVRCYRIHCVASWEPVDERLQQCVWQVDLPRDTETSMALRRAMHYFPNEGEAITFRREDVVDGDMMTLGLEEALSTEPRDEDWAPQAEKLLAQFEGYNDPNCVRTEPIECRAVTCRMTVSSDMNSYYSCPSMVDRAWPNAVDQMFAPSLLSEDGQTRTLFLVREGYQLADVLTLAP